MTRKNCAILLLATSLLAVSCGEGKKQPQGSAQYQTIVVGSKDMTLSREYSARLTGRQIVEVRPQVSGCITRILTNEGETVRKGQTLFVIDQVPFRAALEVAVAARHSSYELSERADATAEQCGGRCQRGDDAQRLDGG